MEHEGSTCFKDPSPRGRPVAEPVELDVDTNSSTDTSISISRGPISKEPDSRHTGRAIKLVGGHDDDEEEEEYTEEEEEEARKPTEVVSLSLRMH